MNKPQLQQLLGPPYFGEGMIAVREWNYLFHVRPASRRPFRSCQLKILFDRHAVAGRLYWRPANCAQLAAKQPMLSAVHPADQAALFASRRENSCR